MMQMAKRRAGCRFEALPMTSVRQLSARDLDAFLTLRTAGLSEAAHNFRVTAADDDKLGRSYWANRLDSDRVFGVMDGTRLIGIGGLSRLVGKKLCHKGLIWGMYILPDARGGQASDLLMEALLNAAMGYVRQVQLTLMASNARARAYYERHGFELYAIEPASVMTPDGPADEALMWRLVGA
jgi:ribosomal protein S18 acetylase RimI-like enzyme